MLVPSEKQMFVSMDVVFKEHEPYYGEPVDLTDVFPDLYVDNATELDNKTGGDKGEKDSDATSQNMIVGVIPIDDLQDDLGVIDARQEGMQGKQQEESNDNI
jgi:hypothetical protein